MEVTTLQGLTPEKQNEQLYNDYNTKDRQDYATNVVEDRDFMLNAQWDSEDTDSLDAADQPAITSNEVTPSIDLVVSMLTENNPRWQFTGVDSGDYKIAADISDLHSHIWDSSNGTQVLEKTVYDYEVAGIGAFMAYPDYYADLGRGEIKIIDIDPLDLYIDPMSKQPDSSDASHILVVKNLTTSQIKNQFPDFYKKHSDDKGNLKIQLITKDGYPTSTRDNPEGQSLYPDVLENKYRAIDRYTKIKEKRYHITEPNGFDKIYTKEQYEDYVTDKAYIQVKSEVETYLTSPSEVRDADRIYAETQGLYHYIVNPQTGETDIVPGAESGDLAIPGSTTQLIPKMKGELVEEGIIKLDLPTVNRVKRVFTIGDELVNEATLPIEDYPIVTFMLHSMRNPFPMSDVRLVRPLQEQLNKIKSKLTAYLSAIANLVAFVPKGSGVKKQLEDQMGKAGLKIFEIDYELGGVPVMAQYPPLPAGVFEEQINIISQIQRIIGAYASSDGAAASAPQTKGGTILIDEYAQRRVNLKRRRLERALNQMAKVISQMIPYTYRDEKVIRIVEPNKRARVTQFNALEGDRIVNDLSIRYDVKVISGSTLPTNKMMKAELLMNMYQNRVITDPTPIIRNLDVDNVDEILEREDRVKQLTGALQQAQNQIKQLSGQLQSKSREIISANEKVEVEKTKTRLKEMESGLKVGVEVGKQRISDEVKKKKDSDKESNQK